MANFLSKYFILACFKTEIVHFHGSGINHTIVVTHHICPFSGEIQNKPQKQLLLNKCNETFESPVFNNHTLTKPTYIIEKPLPFTKDEFEFVKNYPKAPSVSQSVKDFINSDYNVTTIRHSGYYIDAYI